ncbi:pre-mRNA-splicing factor syf2-like [Actinia tenebrosa]|uniref:Pre-mRNA-splicing factor SYF2 n=1 Tax=Actinia tenebrosa TaxID=6105 RepID=A0A6P8IP69_ACTTE|nr:pre-mRNA-splicing factor syf2-like [Actinia tenebrosa]
MASNKISAELDDVEDNGEANTSTASSSSLSPSSSSSSSISNKRAERMKRLKELHLRRNEARKMNYQEVAEEDKRNKLPSNFEAKQRRVEWELQEEEARKAAEDRGEDYDRTKMLQMTADEAERMERKRRKRNPDQGFSDYAQAQQRQYNRLVKQLKPDMGKYSKLKDEVGEELYPTVDNLNYGGEGKVPEEAIDRMVDDLEKQIEKRSKFSRRRAHYDDADIDYINERNMNFNKKLARYYDPFTAEIKQNLERGTAV